jgi:hypothetical protein
MCAQYVAHLIRRVPTRVDASNAECAQAVFKFMTADADGDGCNAAQTFCVRLVECARGLAARI